MRTFPAFSCLIFLLLPLFNAGCSSPYATVDWKEISMRNRLCLAKEDPARPDVERGLWYFKTYTAKSDTSLAGIKLSKGDSLVGVNTSNFLWEESKDSHWIIKPVYSEINFAHTGIALVRKPGSRTLDRLNVYTGELTPTPFTRLVFSVSHLEKGTYTPDPAYPPTRGYEKLVTLENSAPGEYTFVDENFNPLITIHNVVAHHALQGGAIAIEHQTSAGKVLVVYDKKGIPVAPPIADYLIVFGQRINYSSIGKICLLPVDAERGLYWPLANNGTLMPAPEGVIGIKPIFEKDSRRKSPKEPHVVEAAVLWDTPDGDLYAFISDELGNRKVLQDSRGQARWRDFRDAEAALADTDFENVNRYPVRLAQDASGDVFMLPPWGRVERSRSRIVDQGRFSGGLEKLFAGIPYANWNAANQAIKLHNHATANRAWAASVESAKRREEEARQARINARIVAEQKARERQVANDALLRRVEEAIRANRLGSITYDDLRAAYQATPNPSRREAFDKAFKAKQAAEPRPVTVANRNSSGGYQYTPSVSAAAHQAAVQATIQRNNARMQEMEWRHKLQNFNAGRGFTTPYSR